MSDYDKALLVECVKRYTWDNSINDYDMHKDASFAQVAVLADVEQELLWTDAYYSVMQHELNLESFLKSHFQGQDQRNYRFESWGYEVMTVHEYCCDDRCGDTLPYLDPTQNDRLFDHDSLIIIYPHSLKHIFEVNLPSTPEKNSTQFFVDPNGNQLDKEIMHFFLATSNNSTVLSKRQSIINRVTSMLQTHFRSKQISVETFGSCANGLDTEDSDLDLCIIIPRHWLERDTNYGRRDVPMNFGTYFNMRFLGQKLTKLGMTEVQAVPRAVVPICKFKDPLSGINCDINTANDMGVVNSKLIKAYTQLDSRVRPFLYAIKHFSKQRRLNNASLGYLSSYSYVMMGLYYLMTCDRPVIPNLQALNACSVNTCRTKEPNYKLTVYKGKVEEFDVSFHTCVQIIPNKHRHTSYQPTATYWPQQNTDTVSELLSGFFHYYAFDHDYENTVITICHGANYFRPPNWKKYDIAIQDPFIVNRNVSGACYRDAFLDIKEEFARAYSIIKNNGSFDVICSPYKGDRHDKPVTHNYRSRNSNKGRGRAKDKRDGANDVPQLSEADAPRLEHDHPIPSTSKTVKSTTNVSPSSRSKDNNNGGVQIKCPVSVPKPVPSVFVPGPIIAVPVRSHTKKDDIDPKEYLVKFVDMVPGILDVNDFKDVLSEYGRVTDIRTNKKSPETVEEDWHMRVVLDDPVLKPLPDSLDVYHGVHTLKSPNTSTDEPRNVTYTNNVLVSLDNLLSFGAINDLMAAMQDMSLS